MSGASPDIGPSTSTVASIINNLSASASVASLVAATATATNKTSAMSSVSTEISSAAAMAIDPLSHVGDGIFLQTKTAQVLAGVCVWVALFLSCQQVRFIYANFISKQISIVCSIGKETQNAPQWRCIDWTNAKFMWHLEQKCARLLSFYGSSLWYTNRIHAAHCLYCEFVIVHR